MRIAVLADIHGNLSALEAVVADVGAQKPDAVYLAGDQINRCPWTNEVLALLADRGWPAIYGNHDWVVGRINTPQNKPPFTERSRFPSLWWTHEQLTTEHLDAIRQLPAEMCLVFDGCPPIRLLHGIRGNPFEGLLPEAAESTLSAQMATVDESVIVSGHTHRPLARRVAHRQLFNGGSIGMPYNGDPRAQYLILDCEGGIWRPTFRQIEYDRTRVAAAYDSSGYRAACGPIAELYLRTVLTAEPWASDFGVWMRYQPPEVRQDMARAVDAYLHAHGPGRWAFRTE